MDCELKDILRLFMHSQSDLNEFFNEDIESIYEELSDQDDINSNVASILSLMTERLNDLENRLNKLEKEKRRNATNK